MKNSINRKIAVLLATLNTFESKIQAMSIPEKNNNYKISSENEFDLMKFWNQQKKILIPGLVITSLIIGSILYLGSQKDNKKLNLKTEKEVKENIQIFFDCLPKFEDILAYYFESSDPKQNKNKCISDFNISKKIFLQYLKSEKDIKCISTQENIQNNKLIIHHESEGVNYIFTLENNGSLKIQKVNSNQDYELILSVPKKLNFKYQNININIQNIDITKVETDEDEFTTTNPKKTVIVNAANNSISNGAGVAEAIEKAAGPEMTKEIKKWREEAKDACKLNNNQVTNKRNNAVLGAEILETGQSKFGTAGNMKVGAVNHTVGPVASGKLTEKDKKLLANSYTTSLANACKQKFERIVFPSISTGLYHFPIDEASKCASKAIFDFIDTNQKTSIKSIEWAFLDSNQITLMKMFKYYSEVIYSKLNSSKNI